jgi:SAM-dependent methyltransferase
LTERYVQYGCGFCAPADWLNFDASPTLCFERIPLIGALYTKNATRFPANARYGDILRGLPVPDGSCRGVYSSHMLDYLCFEDAKTALRNTRRLVAPGGIFRLVVEDCRRFMRDYLADSSPDAAPRFMQETGWGREKPRGIGEFVRDYLGHPYRLWMWDYPSLSRELAAAGFRAIRPAVFGDCEDPHFATVENKGRWDGAIGIECRA